MKILFICHRIPYPPNKGDKIRSFYILKHLCESNEVYLACLIDDKHDLRYVENLSKYCKEIEFAFINKKLAKLKMFFYLLTSEPLSLAYFGSKKLHKKVNGWLKNINFDAIYVYSSGVAQYAIHAKGVYKIMDYVDVDSDKWKQNAEYSRFPFSWIYRAEANRLQKYERLIAENFEKCIFVTERDKNLFKIFKSDKDAFVIPNGVNLEYFSINSSLDDNKTEELRGNNIVFTGAMDYFANEDGVIYFYQEIYPLVKREIADVKFFVVGSNPTKKIKNLEKDNSIVVTGRVDDIRPYLQNSLVYVAPLRISRGVQNKVLEAMAFELPVVTTSKVLEGIKGEPRENLFVEDEPGEFAKITIELLKNKKMRQKIGKMARKFVEEQHCWEIAFYKIDSLLKEING